MYYSVGARETKAETSVKHSKFLAFCSRVESEEQAETFVKSIKKRFADATHAPYAYLLGDRAEKSRASDDGEPSGTSGVPILETIKKSGVTNAAVVVVRYFGGIKLGTGGLARAYADAAEEAIKAAGKVAFEMCVLYRIPCSYGDLASVSNQVFSFGGSLRNTDYGDNVTIQAAIPSDQKASFLSGLADATSGKVVAEPMDEGYFEVK